jgi:undecaprenyl diphosphate synthase
MVRLPFISSTRAVPETVQVPRHIAIIMDGNGRWARKRLMPRVAGHAKGVDSVREVVRTCLDHKVDYLTCSPSVPRTGVVRRTRCPS